MKTISKEAYSRIHRMVNDNWREKLDAEFGELDEINEDINFSDKSYKDLRNSWNSKSNKRLLDRLFIGHKKMSDKVIDLITNGDDVHITGWWAKEDPMKPQIEMNKPIHLHGSGNNIYIDDYLLGCVGLGDPTVKNARTELIKLLDDGFITFNNPSPITFE